MSFHPQDIVKSQGAELCASYTLGRRIQQQNQNCTGLLFNLPDRVLRWIPAWLFVDSRALAAIDINSTRARPGDVSEETAFGTSLRKLPMGIVILRRDLGG